MKLNEWVNNYIKEVTHSHEYEDMSQMGEDENDPQEISVGNYQTKYFHVCPGASNLYKDIESKGVDMDMAERSARLQDALYFVEEHIQRDGYKPERDYVMVAKNIAKNIMKMAEMMGLEEEHQYIQGHVDTISNAVKEKGLEERVMKLTEENVPTDLSKWSYYKSQAKEKFDVYPSAYANAWAAKQYKAAGGGWKTKKKESIDESKSMDMKKRLKVYDKLKKGDEITIKYGSSMSSGREAKFKVTKGKTVVGKQKVERITLQNVKNPNGVKFYLYQRNGNVTMAIGDMGASIEDMYESVNEGVEPQIKKIAYYTGTRPEAVEDFVSKHSLNITKLLKYVQKGGLPQRMELVSALAGRDGNTTQKKVIKMFSESLTEGKFKVDDLVYNKRTKTVGIVRMGDDKYGEVKTDADGNVDVDELEKYNPIKFKHQTKAKVAPSTEKEVSKRGLFNPFKNESVMNEVNGSLNKKVKKYLDTYLKGTKTNSPEHQEAVMLIMRGALTDANFHSEAKKLNKYFPKAKGKYNGTPMEGVIEDKGVDIAKMAKWDGHDIIDAFAFYLSMSIGGSFGARLQSLKEGITNSEVIEEAEYQGRKVKLNSPMQGDSKKFKVYVKNQKGNVVVVHFGQKGMNIKKNNPKARKSFRARMNCDNPGPKWKANYWSCKKW